jgi:hypothetical protein
MIEMLYFDSTCDKVDTNGVVDSQTAHKTSVTIARQVEQSTHCDN